MMNYQIKRKTILVVDDDHKTVELIKLYLINEGYRVFSAYDGQTAMSLVREQHPDLMILDVMLPEVNGFHVCQSIQDEYDVPIIMVTARTTEEDKLIGLELGADDYVTKPFSPRELVARVKAVLRRANNGKGASTPTQQIGSLIVNFDRYEVTINDNIVNLTPSEFRILTALAEYPGKVFTRQELLELAFSLDYDGLDRTIDVHMMNLRKKIETNPSKPRLIETVYGVGYKLVVEEYAA